MEEPVEVLLALALEQKRYVCQALAKTDSAL
jgi:hypothetical protein